MTFRPRASLLLVLVLALNPVPGAATSLAAADTTPPAVAPPVAAPARLGTVAPRSVPLRVAWTATDTGSGVARTRLQLSVDGGSWVPVPLAGTTSRQAVVRVAPPHHARFRVRAVDGAGNRSPWVVGDATAWRLRGETAAGVTATGEWARVTSDGFLGGTALRSRQPGAELELAFHGSSVAWVGRLSPRGGRAAVYLDGTLLATVSTRAAGTLDRRVLASASWPAAGDHVLTIRPLDDGERTGIVVDGFVVGDEPPAEPTLVGAGDIATCGVPGDNRTADLLDRIPGRVFAAGDTVYPDGTAAQYRNCYDPTWGRWKARTWPAVGNHEYRTDDARPYFEYFGARAGQRGKGWYAEDLGSWRVYVLNSNCDEVGCGPGSEQEAWLRADLAANPRACVAAVMHHPLVSSGQHGDSPAVRPLWEALHAAGADVVLAAHDHDYERFAPLSAGGSPEPDGMRLFVVGTGGGPLRPFATIRAGSEARNAHAWGVLALTLRAGSYAWRFVPVEGQTWTDSGTAACR